VRVVRDDSQDSTDLMKCIGSLQEKEEADGVDVGGLLLSLHAIPSKHQEFIFPNPPVLYRTIFPDSLRRRLTWWLLWATRSDGPLIIVSTQASEKRTSAVRRRG